MPSSKEREHRIITGTISLYIRNMKYKCQFSSICISMNEYRSELWQRKTTLHMTFLILCHISHVLRVKLLLPMIKVMATCNSQRYCSRDSVGSVVSFQAQQRKVDYRQPWDSWFLHSELGPITNVMCYREQIHFLLCNCELKNRISIPLYHYGGIYREKK